MIGQEHRHRRGGGDPHRRGGIRPEAGGEARHRIGRFRHRRRRFEDRPPGLGQLEAVGTALEQRHAEQILQHPHPARDRRLALA